MKKRYLLMFIILILCLIFQGTVFQYWSWAGIKPDLAMLWVTYMAMHHRPVEGMVFGFVAGLIVDLFLGRYIGLYAIVLTVLALVIGFLQQRWYRENIPLTMVLVFMVTFLGQTLLALVAATAGLDWVFGSAAKMIFGISLYNCLLVPLTYPLIHKSFTKGLLKDPS